MKLQELSNIINSRLDEAESDTEMHYSIENSLIQLVKKILDENNYEAEVCEHEYGSREQEIRVYAKGLAYTNNWPAFCIRYKTKRTLVSSRWNYGHKTARYTLKSVDADYWETGKTIEECLQENINSAKEKVQANVAEIEKLEKYITENPEFIEMTKLYTKHKYNSRIRNLADK